MKQQVWRWALCGWLTACAERSAPEEPRQISESVVLKPGAEPVAQAVDAALQMPASDVSAAPKAPETVRVKTATVKPSLEARSCALLSETNVHTDVGRALLSSDHAGALAVLLVNESGFTLQRLREGTLALEASLGLKAAPKRSAFVQSSKRGFVAWVDAEAHMWTVAVAGGKFESPSRVAEGVDRRFAPALSVQGKQALVAFTRSFGPGMHVYVSRIGGEKSTLEDITPEGHGAAAPTFIVGQNAPSIVMIDARAGVSPLLEVRFDGALRPQPAIVRTPVSQPYAPPGLQALSVSSELTLVAFTAIGRAAATAVGLVPLQRAEEATALVPSKGYGELELSAAQHDGLGVFAVEAFRTSSAQGPRQVQVHVIDGAGAGNALEVGGAFESASAPSLAASATPGGFFLSYSTPQGVQLAEIACVK